MSSHTEALDHGTRPAPRRPGPSAGSSWGVPLALVALSLVPLVSGSLRLVEVFGGPAVMPANPRVDASPAPVVVHVTGAFLYALVGALQFSARFRRRHRDWHRRAGRVLVVAGLLVALSGVWMTIFYAGAPGGTLLWAVRLVVGSAMAAALVLGFSAIRRRDVAAHRAWMTRAYALGLGAGTQIFTEGIGQALMGVGDASKAVSVSAGWVVNAAVAEWVVRRPAGRRRARRAAAAQVS